MESKRVRTIKLEKSIDDTLKKLLEKLAKDYLKSFRKEPWYKPALKHFEDTARDISRLLRKQAKAYSGAISDKDIYNKTVKRYRTDEYLDSLYNKIVVDDIRDVLVEMNLSFQEELDKAMKKLEGKFIKVGATEVAGSLGLEFDFNKFDERTRDYLKDKRIKWAKQVQESTEKSIKRILVEGYEKGLGSYDVAQAIKDDTAFSFARAEAIARTETISSCNYIDQSVWEMDDHVIGKEWSATGGPRTRETHSTASGQRVAKDKPFIVGGYRMMHPGDNSMGAPAKEIINCRCTMRPIFEGEKI